MNRNNWLEELRADVRMIIERLWTPTLVHPRLEEARRKVASSLAGPPTKPITTVTGPTRTGKTTLLELLEKALTARYAWLVVQVPYARPVVRFEITAPPSGIFSFASCFVDPLTEELRISMKARRIQDSTPGPDTRVVRTASRRLSMSEAVNAAVETCTFYHVRVLLIDEGHHLGMVRSHVDYIRNLEALKTFVNRTGVRIVLAGTHDLESVRDMSAQLMARSTNARLPRYRIEDARDVKAFKTILRRLSERLPESAPPLEPEWAMLMERSLGLVGILFDWLLTAVSEAATENQLPKLLAYLDRTRLDDDELAAMATEIEDGETARTDVMAERALRRSERHARALERLIELAKVRSRSAGKGRGPKNLKVGRRAPSIDPRLQRGAAA